MTLLLEVCVDTPQGILAAVEGGADRIELCSSLALGGLSPSAGLVHLASQLSIPVYAMVRPRPGNFVFDMADEEAMMAEIDSFRAAGLAGVVLGANHLDGTLDAGLLDRLLKRAQGMGSTLHRAFDLTPDLSAALNTAIELGFERILTSGARPTALEGIDAILAIARKAGGRISIMPGSGVNTTNVEAFLRDGTIGEVHASCSRTIALDTQSRAFAFGFHANDEAETDRNRVEQLRNALSAFGVSRTKQ